jgi:uncharacterized membrane protein
MRLDVRTVDLVRGVNSALTTTPFIQDLLACTTLLRKQTPADFQLFQYLISVLFLCYMTRRRVYLTNIKLCCTDYERVGSG